MNGNMDRSSGAPRTSQDMVGRGAYRAAEAPTFNPASTALLVIDPVNDFLSEGGAGWEMTKSTVKAHDVVGHLREAIDAAHRAGIPVIYGLMARSCCCRTRARTSSRPTGRTTCSASEQRNW